jgi:hypothetical protein
MKRVPFLPFALLALASCTTADSALAPDLGPSYSVTVACPGPITLTTQTQVDDFAATGCTDVAGSLLVTGDDITNLDGLSALTRVSEDFNIEGNPALADLDGLSALTTVGGDPQNGRYHYGLTISNNAVLTSVGGLSALTLVGNLRIGDNPVLANLDGPSALTSVGEILAIGHNATLTNLDGLSALTSAGDLYLEDNPLLANLDGLSALTSVNVGLSVYYNPALTNLDGLSSLATVGGDLNNGGGLGITYNAALTNLDGLSALTSIGGYLGIVDNDALADLHGLSALASVGGDLFIYHNDALTSLDGLWALTSVGGGLWIHENHSLSGCACGLLDLLANGGVAGSVMIQNNATGCNTLAEILVAPPGPDCMCTKLRSFVEILAARGLLNAGQENSLLSKLDNYSEAWGADRPSAPKILAAFINEVEALINGGVLTVEQGQPLIDTAQALIELSSG